MAKNRKAIVLFIILAALFSARVYADDTLNINDLIERAKELDKSEVTIQGEAIGDRMDRGNYSWVNINDGTNAIGIWLSKNEADKIKSYGNYKRKGDTVRITGIFYRACRKHNGEADVHASKVEIVQKGYSAEHRIPLGKVILAGSLSVLAALSSVIYIRFFKNRKM